MAAVELHPLASRTGAQSSTIVSVALPPDASARDEAHDTPTLSSSAPMKYPSPSNDADYVSGGIGIGIGGSNSTDQASSCEDGDLFASSPTARSLSPGDPFADEHAMHYHPHHNGPEWGLHHFDIDRYPALDQYDEITGSPPVRTMTAAQYAELQARYAALDVPHNVVFPFLHGVDGDNAQQCGFFRAPLTGQPTPFYRGLTVLRADMPAPHQRPTHKRGSSSTSTSVHAMQQRARADSLATTASSLNSFDYSDDDDHEEGEHAMDATMAALPASTRRPMAESKSTSSSSTASSDLSRASSLFSAAMTSVDGTSQSGIDENNALRATEAAAYSARANRRRLAHIEPQPMHSMLTSTVLPEELINPPLLSAKGRTSALQVATQAMQFEEFDHVDVVRDACFVRPRQAEGISLRNFKTQCAKYATISDVVIYCPAGIHEGVLTLAQWVRSAQDQLHEERMQRGLGGLRYNVFIITDSFDTFEHYFPHLVAVDGSGFSRNRVDFIDREREEMQRFTEASEIDDNVFMGCSANVPLSMDEYEQHNGDGASSSLSLDSCLPQDANPLAFSVCVEALEMCDVPDSTTLSNAASALDALEAAAALEINSTEGVRPEAVCEDCISNDGRRPSLGPEGWSPRAKSRSSSVSSSSACPHLSKTMSSQPAYFPPPSSIVHMKALGSAGYFEHETEMNDAVERLVQLCVWIYKQSHVPAQQQQQQQPTQSSSSSSLSAGKSLLPSSGSGHLSPSLFHNAWRRHTSWPKPTQQYARRILLHCGDGYTDSSILGLAYLMYARRLSLPDAYLDLQNRCNRCFFVYARDVPFLQRLEKRIAGEVARTRLDEAAVSLTPTTTTRTSSRRGSSRRERERELDSSSSSSDSMTTAIEQSVWARSLAAATGLVAAAQNPGRKSSPSADSHQARTSTPTPRRATPSPSLPRSSVEPVAPVPPPVADHSWFTNTHFQGSFPSRILPFLYLGNLGHALNPAMLHALGITHVVSVGESALLPPQTQEDLVEAAALGTSPQGRSSAAGIKSSSRSVQSPSRSNRGPPQQKTLWEEERGGRISVLDLKNVSDDGIDSLRPHMNRAVEYIEQARLSGGKVLVHCRVGVSRSATICIAYVMAHCDLSMIESFLLVRSRRMNVLTQPTLLFVWEMRGFEAHLAHLKEQRREQLRRRSRKQEQRQLKDTDGSGDRYMRDVIIDNGGGSSSSSDDDAGQDSDAFSLAALSISSNDASYDNTTVGPSNKAQSKRVAPAPMQHDTHSSLETRQSIFYDEDLRVDIGAGAGSVYGMHIPHARQLPFNSGSLTRLDYLSAKLTHGYFCKVLSELNARYMVN